MTTYFYTAGATGDVAVYRLDQAAGRLGRVATLRTGGNLAAIAVSTRARRLYVADRAAPGIATFAIDPGNGTLAELGTAPADGPLVYLSLSADGRFVYGASYHGGFVCAYPVGADGIAAAAVHPPLRFGGEARCHAVVPVPDGTLWVSALGHDLLYRVGHDPGTGELAERQPPVPAGAASGPRHLCVSRDRRELYVLGERNARVTAHPLAPGGERREWSTIPAGIRLAPGLARSGGREYPARDPGTGLPYTWAADLVLSPDGRFLFSSERSSSTVSVTSARTGELAGWTATEERPRGIAVDPGGRFLLATGELSGSVSLYRVGAAGTLRLTDRVPSPGGLVWAEAVDLAGRADGAARTVPEAEGAVR